MRRPATTPVNDSHPASLHGAPRSGTERHATSPGVACMTNRMPQPSLITSGGVCNMRRGRGATTLGMLPPDRRALWARGFWHPLAKRAKSRPHVCARAPPRSRHTMPTTGCAPIESSSLELDGESLALPLQGDLRRCPRFVHRGLRLLFPVLVESGLHCDCGCDSCLGDELVPFPCLEQL